MSTGEQGGKNPQRISSAKFWLKSALVIVVMGSLLAWAWMPSHPEEPVYQGKPLRAWLKTYVDSAGDNEAQTESVAAIRKIGTNGIPTLIRMIQASDSTLRTKLQALAEMQSLFKPNFADAEVTREMALYGFGCLGEDAKGAVPELILIAKKPSGTAWREDAIDALGNMGVSAQAAVPALLAIASDTRDQDRRNAIHALPLIRSSAESVVPVLASCLRDSDGRVRYSAAHSLSKFGEAAKSAAPALIPLLSDPDRHVRMETTNAFKRIDPAAAAAAGIK